MKLKELCKIRKIPKVSDSISETPKLIPSYSSISSSFFKPLKLQEVYDITIEQAPYISLISAFDLNYGKLDRTKIWSPEIVFIDSGNYEARHFSNYKSEKQKQAWNKNILIKTIEELKPISELGIINFDIYTDLEVQINTAIQFFENYPKYIHDFLIKPEKKNKYVWDFKKIEYLREKLNTFDIIGITEKELGDRLDERCKNLIKFREILGEKTPIHIFGCLDFISVILYVLCGADIFDGTSWMRFFYWKGYAVYSKQYDFLTEKWNDKSYLNEIQALKDNLIHNKKFENKLKQFINSLHFKLIDFKLLDLDEIIINRINKILIQLGVEI